MKKQNKLGQAFKEGNEIGRIKQYLKCEKLFLELEELIKKRKQIKQETIRDWKLTGDLKEFNEGKIEVYNELLLEIKKLKEDEKK